MLLALLRILGVVLAVIGLLKIKKTRLRHVPARRTRISRRYGEHTLWAERLVSAVTEMILVSAAEQRAQRREEGELASDNDGRAPDPIGGGASPSGTAAGAAPGRCTWDALLAPLVQQLEERVNAALEDRGVATWSDFRIHSLGERLPVLKAVHVVSGGGGGGPPSAEVLLDREGLPANLQQTSSADFSPEASVLSRSVSVGNPSAAAGAPPDAQSFAGLAPSPSLSLGTGAAPPASTLELEAEVEYSGGASASLRADLSLARGRQLPVYVHIGDIKHVRVHLRMLCRLHYEEATMEKPRKPWLLATIWLESDPAFEMSMSTSLTRFRIKDFFLAPLLTKYVLLRFTRSRMKRMWKSRADGAGAATAAAAAAAAASSATAEGSTTPGSTSTAASAATGSGKGSGVTFRIPLPEGIVDGGEPWLFPNVPDSVSESPEPSVHSGAFSRQRYW